MKPLRVLVLLAVSSLPAPAWALCSLAATAPAAFGSVSSTLVRSTIQSSSSTNAGLQCTGSLLSLLASSDHFYATITSTQTGLRGPTGDIIPYTIYGDSTTSYPVTRGTQFDFARNGILDALGLLNGTSPKSVPLYFKTVVGANVAAGAYSETLNIAWAWDYCPGIAVGSVCVGGRSSGSGTLPLTVTMTVTNDCQITTPAVSFASAPVVAGFATVSQSLSVSCTKGTSYTVGLDDGLNVSGGRRRMKSSANNYLAYDIFKSAGATRWGSVGAARRASGDADINPGAGAGVGVGSQVFNYNAKVYTDQPTPPAATYTDTVTLDVQF